MHAQGSIGHVQAAELAVMAGVEAGGGAALPGMILNTSKKTTFTDAHSGQERSVPAGRMECTMQVGLPSPCTSSYGPMAYTYCCFCQSQTRTLCQVEQTAPPYLPTILLELHASGACLSCKKQHLHSLDTPGYPPQLGAGHQTRSSALQAVLQCSVSADSSTFHGHVRCHWQGDDTPLLVLQNLVDSLGQHFQEALPKGRHAELNTFVVYNQRSRVTSSAKRKRVPGSLAIHQTPDGSFLDLMRNARDMLLRCSFDVPPVS